MQYKKNGQVNCNAVDLAVLHREAQKGKAWATPEAFLNAPHREIPYIPSVQIFVLLAFQPQDETDYSYRLRQTLKISNDTGAFYSERTLFDRSRSEKCRKISTPHPTLMKLQRWILRNILEQLEVSPVSFAYRKGVCLKDNAAPHVGKKQMVKADISHFFETVSYGKVYGVFAEAGYDKPVATLLAKLCTLRGHLPQGAPSSPALANLVMGRFDEIVCAYCDERGIIYTRYSDDLTFSADRMDIAGLLRFVRATLKAEGFSMNSKKIRVLGPGARHQVCGIVTNEVLSVPKSYRRKLRQEVYFLQKSTLAEHIRRMNDPKFIDFDGSIRTDYYLRNLLGRLQFVEQIRHDPKMLEAALQVQDMLFFAEEYPKHPEVGGFLFGEVSSVKREALMIVKLGGEVPPRLLELLLPHSHSFVDCMLKSGRLRRKKTGNLTLGASVRMECTEEDVCFSLRRAEKVLIQMENAGQYTDADILASYIDGLAHSPDFPGEFIWGVDMATRSWRKRMTLQRWERLRGIDFSRLAPCVELSQKMAVVLCPLSEFPKGMTNALTDILFRDQAQTIERLRQTGWLEEITDEKGMLRLRLTERGILSMYQSRELVWTGERMEPICEAIFLAKRNAYRGDYEAFLYASAILWRLCVMEDVPGDTRELCRDTSLTLGIIAARERFKATSTATEADKR